MGDGLNRVMLMGNLGADPELRYTQSGEAVLNMRLATTETYFDRDRNKKERTEWHNIVIWGRRAEALGKFLRKGSSLFVEGGLRTSSFEGRDGQKRYKTEISARNVILTGGKRDGGEGGGGGGAGGAAPPPPARDVGAGSGATDGGPYPDFGPDDKDLPF